MKGVIDSFRHYYLACSKKVIVTGFAALLLFAVLITVSQYESTETSSSFHLKKRFIKNRKLQGVETKSSIKTYQKFKDSTSTLDAKKELETEANLTTSLKLDYIGIIQNLLQDNLILQQKLNRTLQLLKKYTKEEAILCLKPRQELKVEEEQQEKRNFSSEKLEFQIDISSQERSLNLENMSNLKQNKSYESNVSRTEDFVKVPSTTTSNINSTLFDRTRSKNYSNEESTEIIKGSNTASSNSENGVSLSAPLKLSFNEDVTSIRTNTINDESATLANATNESIEDLLNKIGS